MLIEYQVKFQKDGLTITQRVEPNTPPSITDSGPVVTHNALNASNDESKASSAAQTSHKSGAFDDQGKAGSLPALGNTPMTIIGPFIFLQPDGKPTDRESTDGK